MFEIFVMICISVATSAVAYLLAPKQKSGSGTESATMDDPTAEADKCIPVVFGTITVKSPNFIWVGDKSKHEYKV